MFRTGGPIGEGVMHGMNGLQNGGTVRHMNGLANGGMPDKRGLVDGPGGYAGKKGPGFINRNLNPFAKGSSWFNRANAVSNDIFALIMGAGMLPMKNGGVASLANRPGYSWGSKVLKKIGPVGTIYNRGIANIKKGFDTVKGKLGTTKTVTETVPKQGPYTAGGNIYSKGYPGGTKIGTGPGTAEVSKSVYQPGGFLSYIAKSPEGQLAQKIYQGRGFIGKPVKATLKFVGSSPTALIGLTYAGGKYLLPDGTEANEEQIENAKKLTNAAKGGAGTGKVEKTPAEIAAAKKIKDEQQLNKIYSLLGVDRAKKNAASKALIDMSRYIDEGGKDVISKKNLGSTISKAIGAFDKRLDKVDQLKEAAGLMMAKAEVENLMDPYGKELKRTGVEINKAKIAQANDANTIMASFRSTSGGGLTAEQAAKATASKLYKGDYVGNIIDSDTFADLIKENSQTGRGEREVIIKVVEGIADKYNKPNGVYTVQDKIIEIENKKVKNIIVG